MGLDKYDIKQLAKEIPEIFREYKLVKKTTLKVNYADTSNPEGSTTTVEYTLEKKID